MTLDDELPGAAAAERVRALEAALSSMDHAFASPSIDAAGGDGSAASTAAAAAAGFSPSPLYLFQDEELLEHQHEHGLSADHELRLFDIDGSGSEVDLLALEVFAHDDDDGMDELSFRFGSPASPPPHLPCGHARDQQEPQSTQPTVASKTRQKRRQKQRQNETAADAKPKPKAKKITTSTASSPPTPTAATTMTATRTERRKPLNYNPNKARDERREELIYLRGKVQELETQLDDIKQKRPRITASALAPTLPSTSSHSIGFPSFAAISNSSSSSGSDIKPLEQDQRQQLVITGVWEDIATRQCEGRIKAERENIRLKIILENQIKIAKSLEKLLKKKVAARDIEHCPQCQQLHHVYPPTKDPRTDAQIFEDLAAGVELSYKEVDAIFAANGLAQMETPHSDARMRSDGAHGMFLEILANKVLPFDVHSTATAAWHYFVFAKQRTPSRSYFFDSPKTADTTDDTITENFSLGLHANSTSAHFRVKQILRRFVEEERVVIVWRSHVEPVEFSDEPLSGLRFRECGYIVIKRPRTLSGDYTLVQTCYIFTPNFTGDLASGSGGGSGSGDDPKVGAITDFVLSATAANITASHQMIENVLVEQAMRRSDDGLTAL